MNAPIIDATGLCHELGERGVTWADADAAYRALDDVTKSVLAKHANESPETSAAAKERDARCHPKFYEHLESVRRARAVANKARVKYDTYKMFVELTRSNASTERTLARMI